MYFPSQQPINSKISGSDGDKRVDDRLLGFCHVQSGKILPSFQGCLLPKISKPPDNEALYPRRLIFDRLADFDSAAESSITGNVFPIAANKLTGPD